LTLSLVLDGAVVAGVLALIGVLWQTYRGFAELRKVAHATRLAAFLAATHAVALEITRLAVAPMSEKSAIDAELHRDLADRVNRELNAIQLLDREDLVRGALALDKTLVLLGRMAQTQLWEEERWRSIRERALEPVLNDFFAHARSALKTGPVEHAGVTRYAWALAHDRMRGVAAER